MRQHDPEFTADGRIVVFNNNHYMRSFTKGMVSDTSIERTTNMIEIDPATNTTRVIYGGTEDQELLSVVRGKHEALPDGG